MSRRPRKSSTANIIDFATALKRREESQAAAVKREDIEFLPFSFEGVAIREGRIELVIDRDERFGLSMTLKHARLLAKALRSAVRSAKKKDAG